MPKITLIGSCQEAPYEMLFMPNKLDPQLYEKNHEQAYIEACKIVYPGIQQATEVWLYAPKGIGEHTARDLAYAKTNHKRIKVLVDLEDLEVMIGQLSTLINSEGQHPCQTFCARTVEYVYGKLSQMIRREKQNE